MAGPTSHFGTEVAFPGVPERLFPDQIVKDHLLSHR
jgi:hypothetical protein